MSIEVGNRIGRLEVLKLLPSRDVPGSRDRSKWCEVRCDCGTVKEIRRNSLQSGATRSCGCLKREQAQENVKKAIRTPKKGNLQHGKSHTPEWHAWIDIRSRCRNRKNPAWSRYGGRGIKMCRRWQLSFENFLADMGPRPEKCALQRIDNDGPYSPANCHWATREERANNRKSNRLINAFGRVQTLARWAKETGLPATTIASRIDDCGWTVENALRA